MFGIKWQPFKNPTKVSFQPGKMTLLDALSSAMSLTAPGANPLDVAKWSTGNLARAMGVDNLGKMNLQEALTLAGNLQGGGEGSAMSLLAGQLGGAGQSLTSDQIAAILGGAGMLARPETPKHVREAMASVSEQKPIIDRARSLALNYDPVAEDKAAIDAATREAGRALAIGRADMSQRYANAGGTPGLSTNYLYNQQQQTDSVLNPLSRFVAERRSGDTQRRLGMLSAGTAIGSNYAQDMASIGKMVPERDTATAQQMLAQGLNQILGGQAPGTGNQQSGATASGSSPLLQHQWSKQPVAKMQSVAPKLNTGMPEIKLQGFTPKKPGVTPLQRVRIRNVGKKVARMF